MKPLYLLGIIYVAFMMSGCTTVNHQVPMPTEATQVDPVCHKHKAHGDPIKVSVLTHQDKPAHPYKVIGKARISKYNVVGIKRQEATMREIMRQLAVSMDGDAVIDVKNHGRDLVATVITYNETLA
jgi:hypothetical protein